MTSSETGASGTGLSNGLDAITVEQFRGLVAITGSCEKAIDSLILMPDFNANAIQSMARLNAIKRIIHNQEGDLHTQVQFAEAAVKHINVILAASAHIRDTIRKHEDAP